ncbi:MFS general substrate transporter [Coniophora puteana RWD-64-598 SS2]|uniref:MFS general substrate transporter n=1 Tax=Coniophora puteana (strain RWD-64-598) TaxID=741705 RepID=R7SGV2_CONPW|nr:MFS general substrate transporter [Coniophora puteana RWD-64-598 SS2]EIW74274.1 MFS general substrate transporter [Coniophora puteana RWD-64-598 SS2]
MSNADIATLADEHESKHQQETKTGSENVEAGEVERTQPRDLGDGIPDGGLLAWLQVVGAFLVFANTWGICNTFGAYQTYYEGALLSSQSAEQISWIGSLQPFLLLVISVLTGPFFDMGYFRSLTISGSILMVLGVMMTSIATEYWQIILAQGVAFGLGSGMLFTPAIAVVATYFKKRRSFAVGISASGSSIGGVIYPIVFRQLVGSAGFGWATRAIGFIALGTQLIALAVMRQRVVPKTNQRRALFDLSAFKNVPFLLFSFGCFMGFMGLYIPFFYISSYALSKTTASEELAFYFLSILNATSTFGRIIPNFIADYIGPLNTILPCTFASAILAFGWLGVDNVGGLLAFSIIYGFTSGTFVSLPASTVASLTPDLTRVGTWMGMCFAAAGLGVLVGTPVAGALIDIENGVYWKAQLFCAILILVGAVSIAAARVLRAGVKIVWA